MCLVDPEAFDATEQQFSASLEGEAVEQNPRFVPHADGISTAPPDGAVVGTAKIEAQTESVIASSESAFDLGDDTSATVAQLSDDPDAWRREVAARLNQYRSRRKVKAPRYPSLRLKFDPPEQSWNATALLDPPAPSLRTSGPTTYTTRQSTAVEPVEPQEQFDAETALRIEEVVAPLEEIEPTAKIIEFPRSYNPPVRSDELAEPVIDRPRIVEAPEIVPPPPAMGGILMPSMSDQKEPERRPGFDIPLRSAPLGRRIFAAAVDLLVVLVGLAAFGFVVYHLIGVPPPPLKIAEAGIGVTAIFWSMYQYMLLVYNGNTPGLRAARLQLRQFDGRPVSRTVRRWRVITSVLSGLSLGMGYGWSFLDEDALCWHDRITHTYLEPKPKESKTA